MVDCSLRCYWCLGRPLVGSEKSQDDSSIFTGMSFVSGDVWLKFCRWEEKGVILGG